MDVRFLSDLHVPELRLFKIGSDPNFIERDHGQELLPRLNIQPDDNRLVHCTGDRSKDFRVLQIQLGLLQQRPLLLDIGDRSLHSCHRGRN